MKHYLTVVLIGSVAVNAIAGADSTADKWLTAEMPAAWQTDSIVAALPLEDGLGDEATQWWRVFGDTLLNSLENQAVEVNYDMRAALSRIESARASMMQARAGYYPTIGVQAGYNYGQTSGRDRKPYTPAMDASYFALGLSASWEPDIFGRVRERSRQGSKEFDASKADREAVELSLTTSLAQSYFSLRTAQQQLEVALDHIDSQERILRITEARYEAGLASALDVAQARSVVLSTKASVPQLKSAVESYLNSIATLCGVYRRQLPDALSLHLPYPDLQLAADLGVPADLIRRRPDIVAARLRLEALAAAVGIAKEDYLPTLTIQGSVGTSGHNISDLFSSESFTYSVAPTLSWTAFDGLSRKYAVAGAKADLEAAVDQYNLSVMQAVEDVNSSLSRYGAACSQVSIDREVLAQSRKTLELAVDRYKLGLSDFTNVAQAQLTLLESANALVAAKGDQYSRFISICQALGGGW